MAQQPANHYDLIGVGRAVLFALESEVGSRHAGGMKDSIVRICITLLVCWTQAAAADDAASLAAWDRIATVLQHPRCLNCHQLDTPLQGDARRVHIPAVRRGADDMGAGTMRCYNCHNDSGNNAMSGVPGAPHWQLAPISMLWQGLSRAELCRMLKDPARNGGRKPEAIVEHMETEKLVLWGWDPGARRQPIPISHQDFVDLVKVWVSGGSVCPQ